MFEFLKLVAALAAIVVLCGLLGVAVLGKLAMTTAGMVAAPFVGFAMMAVVLCANADRRRGRDGR